MIIDLNLLAPRHAFVLVIMAEDGCLVGHSLNLLLLLCHHIQAFYGFLLLLPCYSSNGGHRRPGGWVCCFQMTLALIQNHSEKI